MTTFTDWDIIRNLLLAGRWTVLLSLVAFTGGALVTLPLLLLRLTGGRQVKRLIRGYIEQEGLSVRVTRSTSNRELLDLIESEMEGPKPSDEPEDVPGEEEEQPEETEERAGRPRRRR